MQIYYCPVLLTPNSSAWPTWPSLESSYHWNIKTSCVPLHLLFLPGITISDSPRVKWIPFPILWAAILFLQWLAISYVVRAQLMLDKFSLKGGPRLCGPCCRSWRGSSHVSVAILVTGILSEASELYFCGCYWQLLATVHRSRWQQWWDPVIGLKFSVLIFQGHTMQCLFSRVNYWATLKI